MTEVPLHSQIRRSIQQKITDGDWPPQFRIPPEAELARQFNVSRMTARHAVQKLVDKGLLYRRRGIGTFVTPMRMERSLSRLTSFSEDATALGLETSSDIRSIDTHRAEGEVARHLSLATYDRVIRIERLRRHDGTPVALQTLYVPEQICPELASPEVAAGSVYAYYERVHNYRLGWGVQTIGAIAPTREERTVLRMPSDAALVVVRRTTYLDDGTPLEYGETRYRSDQQSFTVTLHR